MYIKVKPVMMSLSDSARLCRSPYVGHSDGCPNYGIRPTCCPQAPLFTDHFDISQAYAVFITFPLGAHVESMRKKHPNWSERQLSCCLYWQGTARKILREEVKGFQSDFPDFDVTYCPEAMGVNVSATMRQEGFWLSWPPKVESYHICLAARPKTVPLQGKELMDAVEAAHKATAKSTLKDGGEG